MQPSLFFESLFKRKAADAANADYLKQLVEEHPYFSPAQFFLLQQTDTNDAAYTKQAAKTTALFNNPYWLNFQLLRMQQESETGSAIAAEENRLPVIENNTQKIEEATTTAYHTTDNTFENTVEDAAPVIIENQIEAPQEFTHPENNIIEPLVETAQAPTPIIPEEKTSITNQVNGNEDQLVFQPLYTSDYFASQGIKLSEDVQANDKLGKQLRSFTDWLKTMKKIAPEKIQANHSSQNDSAIQTLAEKSNMEEETLTETMADIFMQQGKKAKAVETYEKLSLLNPDKSAYFAAKLEQLKEH